MLLTPEEEILSVYKEATNNLFHEGAFNYAKALCCLKWISVIKVRTHCMLFLLANVHDHGVHETVLWQHNNAMNIMLLL